MPVAYARKCIYKITADKSRNTSFAIPNEDQSALTPLSSKLPELLHDKLRALTLNNRHCILLKHAQRLCLPLLVLLRLRSLRLKPIVSIVPTPRRAIIIRIPSWSVVPVSIPTRSIIIVWVAPRPVVPVVRIILVVSRATRFLSGRPPRRWVVVFVVSARTSAWFWPFSWLTITISGIRTTCGAGLRRPLGACISTARSRWRTFVIGRRCTLATWSRGRTLVVRRWASISAAVGSRWRALRVGVWIWLWRVGASATRRCVTWV